MWFSAAGRNIFSVYSLSIRLAEKAGVTEEIAFLATFIHSWGTPWRRGPTR